MARSRRTAREVSAGGVVLRDADEVLVVTPVRRAAGGKRVLALPKGHVDPGETAAQAATREVREEGGVDAELLEPLGNVRYFYQRDGRRIAKQVSFFLFAYRSGDVADHDDEIEEARWTTLGAALRELSHRGEREMVQRARERLRR